MPYKWKGVKKAFSYHKGYNRVTFRPLLVVLGHKWRKQTPSKIENKVGFIFWMIFKKCIITELCRTSYHLSSKCYPSTKMHKIFTCYIHHKVIHQHHQSSGAVTEISELHQESQLHFHLNSTWNIMVWTKSRVLLILTSFISKLDS